MSSCGRAIDGWVNDVGLVVVAEHSQSEARRIQRAARAGMLVRLQAGVYLPSGVVEQPRHRIAAVWCKHPGVVFTHHAAAALSWWPDIDVPEIRVAGARLDLPGVVSSQARLDASWVVTREGLHRAHTALSVLQLTEFFGGDVIDRGLRSGAVRLPELRAAFAVMPAGRRGRRTVAQLLDDSCDNPWSFLERQGHRLLRAEGIGGWQANRRITVKGRHYFGDIVFARLRLVIELDGLASHRTREQLNRDNSRQRALTLGHWTVLRFSFADLHEMVPAVRQHARSLGVAV